MQTGLPVLRLIAAACAVAAAPHLPASAEDAPEAARIGLGSEPSHAASALLLGQNLEAALDAIPGMLADRLDNPKFLGPPDAITGLAPGWRHNSDIMNDVRFELTPGAGMQGTNAAQLIQNFSDLYPLGLLQTGRQVRAGETLEVELWARPWHAPVTVKVGLLPQPSRFPAYAEAAIEVTSAHYRRYTATLTCPADDDEAAFYCVVQGQGGLWLDQIHLRPAGEGVVCRPLLDALADLRIPVLRFPGGIATAVYHWRLGTGPVERRPTVHDPGFKNRMYYDFGTDEYLELCRDQGIMPHITVNVGFSTPEEAGDWARYCADWFRSRGIEPPPAYFQIGNHPYISAELSHMTPEMYVETLRSYVPLVRDGYPNARIQAVVDPYNAQWRDVVLDGSAGLFDVVALQAYAPLPADRPYPSAEAAAESAVAHMAAVSDWVPSLGELIGETAEELAKRNLPTRISYVEWNLWGQASHRDGRNFTEPYDTQHALFTASMIHEFMRRASVVEAAYFYHLINPMGIFLHRGADLEETCLVELFKLYRPALPGDVLPIAVSAPDLGKRPAVDAAAVRNAEGTWIYCVNFHPEKAFRVELPGAELAGCEAVCLAGTTAEGQPQRSEKVLQNGPVELPPLSITRIHAR